MFAWFVLSLSVLLASRLLGVALAHRVAHVPDLLLPQCPGNRIASARRARNAGRQGSLLFVRGCSIILDVHALADQTMTMQGDKGEGRE